MEVNEEKLRLIAVLRNNLKYKLIKKPKLSAKTRMPNKMCIWYYIVSNDLIFIHSKILSIIKIAGRYCVYKSI